MQFGVVAVIADVEFAHQHVLDKVQGEFGAVREVELVFLHPRMSLDETGPAQVNGRFGPRPVGVFLKGHRITLVIEHTHGRHPERLVARGEHGFVVETAHERGCVLDGEPLGDLNGSLAKDVVLIITFVARVIDTVLVEEAARQVIRRLVAAARDREIVLMSGRVVLVENLVPVGVAEVFVAVVRRVDTPLLVRRVAVAAFEFGVPGAAELEDVVDICRIDTFVVDIGFEIGTCPVVAVIDDLRRHRTLVKVIRTVVGDLHPALFGFLGRDEDHAECTARTVDGRRGGILQDGVALDVFGVDGGDVGLDAVDQHECGTACADRVFRAADLDRCATGRLTVGKGDRHARYGALQRTRGVLVGAEPIFDVLARNGLDGAYDIAFFLHAVTDDHDLFERGVVLQQNDVDRRLVVDVDELGLVADEAEIERLLAGGFDGVATVGIGRRTARRVRDCDGYTDNGIATLVFNDTGNGISPPSAGRRPSWQSKQVQP